LKIVVLPEFGLPASAIVSVAVEEAARSEVSWQEDTIDLHRDHHVLGLLIAKGEAVAAEAELDRIAQRSSADHFNLRPVAEAHFQQATADIGIAAHGYNLPAATNAQGV
jgi:hypothetical protein